MKHIRKLGLAGLLAVSSINSAFADGKVEAPGPFTSGTYMDWMQTVYNRPGMTQIVQLALTLYDKDYNLSPGGAQSWSQSDDGLSWTFNLQPDLKWSDGTPLTAHDYVFGLQRAAEQGYDFGWYWDFAGKVKNWKAATEGEVAPSEIGVRAADDHTLVIETTAPVAYMPAVTTALYPVPRHAVEAHGNEYAADESTLVASGPYVVSEWAKANNAMTFVPNENYVGPWPASLAEIKMDPEIGAPEVGLPAFLAEEASFTGLNAGQILFVEQRYPDQVATNTVFATFYLSFDTDMAPFDNPLVRQALWHAIDRDELTETVLRGSAIPAGSIVPKGFPGHQEQIAGQVTFDPEKARALLAEAGYPNGEGFPEVELWSRDQGGYTGAITGPTVEYLQAEFAEHLGVEIGLKTMTVREWVDALNNRSNNFFFAPYEFDYADPSNWYGIFYSGGRHHHNNDDYNALVDKAGATTDWDTRLGHYADAEQILIDNATIVPLVHPVTTSVMAENLSGDGAEPNGAGFTVLDTLPHYFYTHLSAE